jgi:hypothetical protein
VPGVLPRGGEAEGTNAGAALLGEGEEAGAMVDAGAGDVFEEDTVAGLERCHERAFKLGPSGSVIGLADEVEIASGSKVVRITPGHATSPLCIGVHADVATRSRAAHFANGDRNIGPTRAGGGDKWCVLWHKRRDSKASQCCSEKGNAKGTLARHGGGRVEAGECKGLCRSTEEVLLVL